MSPFTASLITSAIFFFRVIAVIDEDMHKFEASRIVPDVIEATPTKKLRVEYRKAVADLGNDIRPNEAADMPDISDFGADSGSLYTLLMFDPDAPFPANPKFRSWLHWLVINIPSGEVEKGEVVEEYAPPSPPKTSPAHRYVFLVYEQGEKLAMDSFPKDIRKAIDTRKSFNVGVFVNSQNLRNPIAGNFFLSKA